MEYTVELYKEGHRYEDIQNHLLHRLLWTLGNIYEPNTIEIEQYKRLFISDGDCQKLSWDGTYKIALELIPLIMKEIYNSRRCFLNESISIINKKNEEIDYLKNNCKVLLSAFTNLDLKHSKCKKKKTKVKNKGN